jgi:hypothetical protein
MPRPMKDVVVLLPGILGIVLRKDGKDVWAFSGGATAEMGEEDASSGRIAARTYAGFLARHVDVTEISAWPRGKVDRAWQEWRAQAGGG